MIICDVQVHVSGSGGLEPNGSITQNGEKVAVNPVTNMESARDSA